MKPECDLGDRPIEAVWWGDEQCGYKVGYQGVTVINRVMVPGNGAMVPWLQVWAGDVLLSRVNPCQVEEIIYRTPAPEGE